jgi:hypothetical protein
VASIRVASRTAARRGEAHAVLLTGTRPHRDLRLGGLLELAARAAEMPRPAR